MKKNFKSKKRLTVAKHLISTLVASTVLVAGLTTTSHAVSNKEIEEEKQKLDKLENEIFSIFEKLEQNSNKYLKKKIEEFKNSYEKPFDLEQDLKNSGTILNLLTKDINNLNEHNGCLENLIKILGNLISYNEKSQLLTDGYYTDTSKLKDFIKITLKQLENISNTVEEKAQIIKYLIIMAKCANEDLELKEIFPNFKNYFEECNENNYPDFTKLNTYSSGASSLAIKDIKAFNKAMLKYIEEIKKSQETISQINFLKEVFEKKIKCLQNLEKLQIKFKENQKVNLKGGEQQNNVSYKANNKDSDKGSSSKPKTGSNSENWSFLAASSLLVTAIGLFLSKFFFKKRKLDEIYN
ncbi:MAG: hypothetical protein LBT82_02340 [Oscillospiraceae bacterium]|jgi:hypothetical protein|nr:hypothetical protein [Oscillospiraceae bacterium]